MKVLLTKHFYFTFLLTIFFLSGCARDLSHTTYTSDSTLNIVLAGQVISTREVKIKETDRLGDNSAGAFIGGLGGGAVGASGGNNAAIVGGAIAGGLIGAVTQQALGTSTGSEYIIKIDRSSMGQEYYEGSASMRNAISAVRASGIITVVQARESKNDPKISIGQNVLVIISEKRTRVIPDASK